MLQFGWMFTSQIHLNNFDIRSIKQNFNSSFPLSLLFYLRLPQHGHSFGEVKPLCRLISYSRRRCEEIRSLVTENALSLHYQHSCASLLFAWKLFIQPEKRPLLTTGEPHIQDQWTTLCSLIQDLLVSVVESFKLEIKISLQPGGMWKTN